MDIRQLRYFVSILSHGSLSKAADQLHVAQPAVGLQLRKLEDELGVKLVVRHSRGIKPTAAGRMLLAEAQDILARVEAVKRRFTDLSAEPEGQITIGFSPTVLPLPGELVRRFSVEAPRVFVNVKEELSGVLLEGIDSGTLDLAVARCNGDRPGVRIEPLFKEALYFIESSRNAAPRGPVITLAKAAEHALVMHRTPNYPENSLAQVARSRGIEFVVLCEVRSIATIGGLVEEGVGATILPATALQKPLGEGRLVATRIVDPEFYHSIALVTARSRPLSRIEQIACQYIREFVVQEVARPGTRWLPPDSQ